MTPQSRAQLALCSWSGKPQAPPALIRNLREVGLRRVQLALDPLLYEPVWREAPAALRASGIDIVSAMFETLYEDYSTPATIRATGGLWPDAAFAETLERVPLYVALMDRLAIQQVSFHAGFMPADPRERRYELMCRRIAQVADAFAASGRQLLLETGQETAATLLHTLDALKRPNLKVNFDPGNMLLYGMGDPIEALERLLPYIAQVHVKDAIRSDDPEQWGREMPAGEGEVDWQRFFATLQAAGYTGNLVIECESRDGDTVAAIQRALVHLRRYLQ